MYRNKSKTLYYILAIAVIACIIFLALWEAPAPSVEVIKEIPIDKLISE